MSTPFASIGGIASGLDTASIIQQLMQLERQPMMAIQRREQQYQRAHDAWGQINSKLSSLRSATDTLRDPKALGGTVKVSSSNDAVATATATGSGAQTGSVSLQVDQLAKAHQIALGGGFDSAEAQVGAGTLTVTRGDTTHTVELGEGATLADAARALNGLEGFSARVVDTGAQGHRLVMTSTSSGTASQFSVDTEIDAFTDGGEVIGEILATGQNAKLRMGNLEITRATNTVDDLIDGVSLRLADAGNVTVNIEQDLQEGTKKVKALVDGMNGLLDELAKQSRTSQEANNRGPLAGDSLVRSLQMDLRSTISQVVNDDGPFRTMSDIGISLTRDGKITLDESKLQAALTEDTDAVGKILGRAATASDARVEVAGSGHAEPGEYEFKLDKASRVAAATGATYSPPLGDPKTFTITVDGKTINVTINGDDSAAQAVQRINEALEAAGVSRLQASAIDEGTDVEGNEQFRLAIEATQAGSRWTFEVAGSGVLGLDGVHEGVDAEGRLIDADGTEYELTGNGRNLTAPTDTPVHGLILRTPVGLEEGVTHDLGTVKVQDGLAGSLDRYLRQAEGSGGSIARAREAIDGRISSTRDSLEAFERRLEVREQTIRRQFTALESAMAKMNSQMSWLSSQLAGMQQG
jgi:flagellar hook-associated protein 2